jgi:hypothetical protein
MRNCSDGGVDERENRANCSISILNSIRIKKTITAGYFLSRIMGGDSRIDLFRRVIDKIYRLSLFFYIVPIHGFVNGNIKFSIQKCAIFRKFKEIKELRGGVLLYAAQAIPSIDAEIAEKSHLWTETNYW